MNQHLSFKHDVIANSDEKYRKILGYMKKNDGSGRSDTSQTKQCTSSHELTQNITLWFCRDLLSFENVCKDGFIDFFTKNLPQLHLPSANSLANTALDDVIEQYMVQ